MQSSFAVIICSYQLQLLFAVIICNYHLSSSFALIICLNHLLSSFALIIWPHFCKQFLQTTPISHHHHSFYITLDYREIHISHAEVDVWKKNSIYMQKFKKFDLRRKKTFFEEKYKNIVIFKKSLIIFIIFKKKPSMSSYFACKDWCMKKKFHLYAKIQKVQPEEKRHFWKQTSWEHSHFESIFLMRNEEETRKHDHFQNIFLLFLKNVPLSRSNFLDFWIQVKFFFHTSTSACKIWTHWWFFFLKIMKMIKVLLKMTMFSCLFSKNVFFLLRSNFLNFCIQIEFFFIHQSLHAKYELLDD